MSMTLPLTAVLFLSACVGFTSTPRPPALDFCTVGQPIPNSIHNVPATRVAVDQHNAIGVDLCGW